MFPLIIITSFIRAADAGDEWVRGDEKDSCQRVGIWDSHSDHRDKCTRMGRTWTQVY